MRFRTRHLEYRQTNAQAVVVKIVLTGKLKGVAPSVKDHGELLRWGPY